MKHFPFLIFVLLVFAACNSNKSKTTSTDTIKSTSQETTSDDLWEDPPMLLGSFEVDELKQAPYNEWYVPIYEETVLDEERVAYLGTLMEDVEIIGFVGTWCNDTQIELPNLFKILNRIDFDQNKIELVGVDEEYQAPDGSNIEWNIERVPTFIFIKDNQELGRFVEFPDESLVEDIIKILKENQ